MMDKKNVVAALLGLFVICIGGCASREKLVQDISATSLVRKIFEKKSIYHAVLPCASCSGIDTWVVIRNTAEGMQFTMVEEYLEEKDAVFFYHGKVKQLKDSAVIQLQREDGPVNYLVGKNYISLLDADLTGTNVDRTYMLQKMPAILEK